MKKLVLVVILGCLGLLAHAQDSDDILMIVAGKMVSLTDFQNAYSQNQQNVSYSKEQVNDFLKHYVDNRLLVAEAEALHLDTLREFRMRLASIISAVNGGTPAVDESWKRLYQGKPCIKIAHLFVPVHQHAAYSEQQELRGRMDSAYSAIIGGADFMQVAQKIARGHVTEEWLGRAETIDDIETEAFRLSPGEISMPLLSYDGFHLMKCLKVGFDEQDETPVNLLNSNSQIDVSAYRSGLLVQYLYDSEMRGRAKTDEIGLRQYFAENQKKFAWDIPHYKGIVYQCKDKKTRKQIKKLLAKQPMDRWMEIVNDETYSHVFQHARVTPVQLFVLGQNEMVDELAFGGPKAAADATYPLYDILGKELKKYPDDVKDVEEMAVADYQVYLESDWLEKLRKRHEVAINEKVLKKLYK